MRSEFESMRAGLSSPIGDGEAVDTSAADHVFSTPTRALFVGVAGDITVELKSAAVITFRNVAAGCERPWRVKRVLKVGTSATDLVGLW